LGAFGFTTATHSVEGVCGAVSGRGLISEPEFCAAAASSMGFRPLGDRTFPEVSLDSDRHGIGCSVEINNHLNFVPPTVEFSTIDEDFNRFSICAVAEDCSNVDGKSIEMIPSEILFISSLPNLVYI
jgi:hypothetical protein